MYDIINMFSLGWALGREVFLIITVNGIGRMRERRTWLVVAYGGLV